MAVRHREAGTAGAAGETAADYTSGMEIQTLLIVVAGLLVAAVALLLVLVLRRPGGAVDDAAARARLEAELESARARIADGEAVQQQLESERIERHSAARLLTEKETALSQANDRIAALEAGQGELRERLGEAQRERAQLEANLEHARQAQVDMRKFVDEARTRLSADFAVLAGKAFEERGQVFEKQVRNATAQGKVDIETLLKPFSDRLGEFRTRIDTLYGEEAKERSALFGAVNELKTLNQDMASQTASLTQALKGNSRVRGDWGELVLESVLRGSGLEEGVHYERQASMRDEEGRQLRPDVLVRLPDERCVVVDSKVNLIAWQEAMNAMDEPELHSAELRRHAEGLRRHVKDLSDRAYPKAVGSSALDMTVAFVPIEGALSAALGADPDLQTYAFERKVVFASPNTLMALLRVIDRLWVRDTMQKRALEIGETGGKVLDALQGFLTEFDGVGRKLEDAGKAFSAARNRLSESNQSVIRRAQRLSDLGARSKRALSEELKASGTDALLPQAVAESGEEDEP